MTGPEASVPVAGWREFIDLPAWGVRRVRAKLDTGARTCALDVASVQALDGDRVRFEVVVRERPVRRTVTVEADVCRRSSVRPSSGEQQERVVVRTTLRIGLVERVVEIGLVPRRNMLCRMLVGRTALAGAVVVDPARRYVLTSPRRAGRSGPEGRGRSA